jgi:hypothetical protein
MQTGKRQMRCFPHSSDRLSPDQYGQQRVLRPGRQRFLDNTARGTSSGTTV